jgi:branched-chain amino acid transport system substrate-binding protein
VKAMTLFKKVVTIATFAITAVTAASAQAQETIKIGLVLSLSGPAAAFGIPERDTIKILADKYNKDAGATGRKIELVYYDDMTNPTEAARGATKLIDQDRVVAIIGATTGSGALALAPIAAAKSVPVVAPAGTISLISKEHAFFPWIFRSSVSDEVAVAQALDRGIFAANKKNVAIVYQEDAYGKSTKDYIVTKLKERNINVVAEVSAALNAKDLTPAATKIRNANPDAIFVQASAPALGAAFARAAKQVGITAPLIGSFALNQRAFLDNAGTSADGMVMVSLGNWDDPSVRQKQLGDLLTKNGKTPTGFGELLGAAAFQALTEAIKRSPSPVTGAKLRDGLESICDFEGTYLDGKLCYKDTHQGIGADSLVKMTIQSGKLKTVP